MVDREAAELRQAGRAKRLRRTAHGGLRPHGDPPKNGKLRVGFDPFAKSSGDAYPFSNAGVPDRLLIVNECARLEPDDFRFAHIPS